MLVYFKRGKFKNSVKIRYAWCTKNHQTKPYNKYVKTLIIRGIGYRAFGVSNDLAYKGSRATDSSFVESFRMLYSGHECNDYQEASQVVNLEFPKNRYLLVRAGHTNDLRLPMHRLVTCISRKKDRKLVLACKNNMLVSNMTKYVHLYRAPSVYTGRGVRIKHVKPVRKAGKKDKQRGKAF